MERDKIKERVLLADRITKCERVKLLGNDFATLLRRDVNLHIAAIQGTGIEIPPKVQIKLTLRQVAEMCKDLEELPLDAPLATITKLASKIADVFSLWEYLDSDDNVKCPEFDGLFPKLSSVAAALSDQEQELTLGQGDSEGDIQTDEVWKAGLS
jgi:predicted mannosyl-3-phosphoglycerate phosphatase (HAD superfamily)